MSEKYNARELAFHYLARLPDALSEEAYLAKLISTEAKFTEILTASDRPSEDSGLKTWEMLGRQP